jgi:hypothetical protein
MDINALINNIIRGNELVVVFAIIATPFIVICCVLAMLIVRANRTVQASKDWPMTEGRILSSGVSKHTHSSRITYHTPLISYEYKVNGKLHKSRRIRVSAGMGYGSAKMAQAIVERYPEGSTQSVYYDPAKPEMAVLERDASEANRVMTWAILFLLFMLTITAIGLLGLSGWGR